MKTIFLTVWTVLACAACCFAVGDSAIPPPSAFDGFITNTLQPLLLSLLAAIVAAAVAYITALLKRKFGLEISTATEARISQVAYNAVRAVEEKAAASLAITGQKWASESKYTAALNYVLSLVPTLSKEEADARINTALATIKGLGATKAIGS